MEPLEEKSLQSRIKSITPIKNKISQSVRQQDKDNPYPRWIKTGTRDKGRAIGDVLQGFPLYLDLGEYAPPEKPKILVAGRCVTGKQSLHTALVASYSLRIFERARTSR